MCPVSNGGRIKSQKELRKMKGQRKRKRNTEEVREDAERAKKRHFMEIPSRKGNYFKNLQFSSARKRFSSEFIPWIAETFGDFDTFMEFLSRSNAFRKWKRSRIRKLKRNIVKHCAKQFSSLQKNSVNFFLRSNLSLAEWKKETEFWSKKRKQKTGRMISRRYYGMVIMNKVSTQRTGDQLSTR